MTVMVDIRSVHLADATDACPRHARTRAFLSKVL